MTLRPLVPTLKPRVRFRPEVLAPAGDLESLRAGLAAGADAVYFGLDEGFNARARAANFSVETLAAVVDEVHRAGARAYLTLNTLIFEVELPEVARLLGEAAAAGIDALIVQDPGLALLARRIAPTLELHASTQMTISSAEGARFAQTLGITRIVVPRELSVAEIGKLAAETPLEIEVFIHGALCMSWSGQCMTSEAWGGRSANRGQCAQSCRMPYDLLVDGEHKPLGDVRYLLSPKDLNGLRAVPALMEIGVHTLKIEGRLKGPSYVATAVGGLRNWMDALEAEAAEGPEAQQRLADDVAAMMRTYSRGFSDGFLGASDHQMLVDGRSPKHRGALLGIVTRVDGLRVELALPPSSYVPAAGPTLQPLPALGGAPDANTGVAPAPVTPKPGMGVVFDQGRPEDKDEPGGPIFAATPLPDGGWLLQFGRPGPNLASVRAGQRVWVTSDPELTSATDRLLRSTRPGRIPVDVVIHGQVGAPLVVRWTAGGQTVEAATPETLAASDNAGLDDATLHSKLLALGGTPFCVGAVDTTGLEPRLHVPVSALKTLRRSALTALEDQLLASKRHVVVAGAHVEQTRQALATAAGLGPAAGEPVASSSPALDACVLVPLCRTPEQLEAVIEAGLAEVELDWMELVGLGKAVARAREAGLRVHIATMRVQKPGEEGFDRRIANLQPDGVLVRHWGGVMHFAEHGRGASERSVALHGDFSLNLTNSLAALHVLSLGLDTITAAHDLDAVQLQALLAAVPASRVAVTVHHHIATFHTEHCVYAHTLSNGRDWRTCGRPCEEHRVALRDHKGLAHPVVVDVGCRNTVFNAQAQSAAPLFPTLRAAGVRRFRVEFVWESRAEAAAVLQAWQDLLAGRIAPSDVVSRVNAVEQFGVTAGTMRVLQPRVGPTAGAHQARATR